MSEQLLELPLRPPDVGGLDEPGRRAVALWWATPDVDGLAISQYRASQEGEGEFGFMAHDLWVAADYSNEPTVIGPLFDYLGIACQETGDGQDLPSRQLSFAHPKVLNERLLDLNLPAEHKLPQLIPWDGELFPERAQIETIRDAKGFLVGTRGDVVIHDTFTHSLGAQVFVPPNVMDVLVDLATQALDQDEVAVKRLAGGLETSLNAHSFGYEVKTALAHEQPLSAQDDAQANRRRMADAHKSWMRGAHQLLALLGDPLPCTEALEAQATTLRHHCLMIGMAVLKRKTGSLAATIAGSI